MCPAGLPLATRRLLWQDRRRWAANRAKRWGRKGEQLKLLNDLRCAGLVLTLTPAGDLHVAPRSALTDDHRAAIHAQRDALLLALRAEAETPPTPPPRRSGNPLMTPEQGERLMRAGKGGDKA